MERWTPLRFLTALAWHEKDKKEPRLTDYYLMALRGTWLKDWDGGFDDLTLRPSDGKVEVLSKEEATRRSKLAHGWPEHLIGKDGKLPQLGN